MMTGTPENKKPKIPDRAVVIAALLILLALGLIALFSPGGNFSEWERRELADRPAAPDFLHWNTDKALEGFLKDHIPGRRMLVAADSAFQFLTGRGSRLNTWYVNGALVELPVPADSRALETKLRRFERLAGDVPWVLLTPKTHGWLRRNQMIPSMAACYDTEAEAYAILESCGNAVAMPEAFNENPDEMYYHTDHHWTLQGAWQAYQALGKRLGYEPLPMEAFKLTEYGGFRGTTLSRSGLPALWQDTLRCAEPDSPVTLTMPDRSGETEENRLIFPEDAATYDGYAVYLHGNHGVLVIERPDAPEGTLVVFKDSFANCLLPLLSRHYRRIIAADARYGSGLFSDVLSRSDDTKAILFLYSLDSLVNDSEITKWAK